MPAPSTVLKNSAAVTLGSVVAGIGYASLIERNAFVVREVTMPVLSPGSSPLKVLHISDIHMRPKQRRKQAWLRELASLEPDLVVNTGDNLAHPKAVPAVVQSLSDLLSLPGVFVFGSNDYFGPRVKNPANYLTNPGHRVHGAPLPWQDLRAAFTERGWLDLTHTKRELEVAGMALSVARQPGCESDAGIDPFARAAGAGSFRRRRVSARDGRPHPRWAAVPAVLRRDRHQL
jgi:predicted MPP superfamily phosphohydrolase